jgi:hypothetical protein
MKTREQIIAEIVESHERHYCKKSEKEDYYNALAAELGRAYVDQLFAEHYGYSKVIEEELAKSLTEESYLTCEDFDHFDITCCDSCHTSYPHYEMSAVLLSDGRHAWVCHCIGAILMRRTKAVLFDDIFGRRRADPIGDALHEACIVAGSDEEKLYYCLKYAHHKHGRKRGHETVETLVALALGLAGRGTAQSSQTP